MGRVLQAVAVVITAILVVGALWGVRWILAWDDLAAYAKPDGFHQIGHRWKYEGNGDCLTFFGKGCDAYCYHDWIYVSDDRTFEEAIKALADRYRGSGWSVRGCGSGEPAVNPSDPCGMYAIRGNYNACFSYSDFKIDHRFRDDWRQHFASRIDESMSAILVTTSCG